MIVWRARTTSVCVFSLKSGGLHTTWIWQPQLQPLQAFKIWKTFVCRTDLSKMTQDKQPLSPRASLAYTDQGQWVEIQRTTFRNWVNEQLRRAGVSIGELRTDFTDGVNLVTLVESLTGRSVPGVVRKPSNQYQKLQNITVALDTVAKDGVKIINIGGLKLEAVCCVGALYSICVSWFLVFFVCLFVVFVVVVLFVALLFLCICRCCCFICITTCVLVCMCDPPPRNESLCAKPTFAVARNLLQGCENVDFEISVVTA